MGMLVSANIWCALLEYPCLSMTTIATSLSADSITLESSSLSSLMAMISSWLILGLDGGV